MHLFRSLKTSSFSFFLFHFVDISSKALHGDFSDAEDEIESSALFHDHFKVGEETETPTVFILPGDDEVGLSTNGRLEDLNDSLEPRPLYDERFSDNDDGGRPTERELFRSSMRDPPCSYFSCKSDRNDKRRVSECHCSHHEHHDRYERSSFHGDCTSERCHSHKDTPCCSDSCCGSHCSKGSEHGGCHHSYHASSRGCHDQMCGSVHCHGSRCHSDNCYQKHYWREHMMDEEEHRMRSKNSAMFKQMHDSRFIGERGSHRNPYDSYPPPFGDSMFMTPDPIYNQRRTSRSTSANYKQHHMERAGDYRYNRKHPDSDLGPIEGTGITKNVSNFKGNHRDLESGLPVTRQRGRRDILTAPGSAIRRMKELVSKYSDRQGKESESVTMLNRPENMDIGEGEMHAAPNEQAMEKPEAYVCHICGKEFAWAITLKRHMLIHTGIRQYQCTICNKAFTRSHHLKRHMTVHTGEKPYVCHICNKAYSRSDRLSSHMNNHEGYVANKKRGRMPAKAADDKVGLVQSSATEKVQDSSSMDAEEKTNASLENHMQQPLSKEVRVASRESVGGERQWMEKPPSVTDGALAEQSWTATEDMRPGFRIVTSEQTSWASNPSDQRKEEKSDREVTVREKNENENLDRGHDGDFDAKIPSSSQSSSKNYNFPQHEDEGQAAKTNLLSPSEIVKSSSPYQGFGLSRTEKDTLAKFKIHSPEIRPPEFRPPDYFAPPGFGLQGHSGPGFIPGSMLDAKQSNLPLFHGAMFRHDGNSGNRTSPLGRDPRGPGLSFLPNDPSKFAYNSLLNAQTEFISKQRMGHPLFSHDLPHEMNRPDDAMLRMKSEDPEVKYSSDILGNYHNPRKEEGYTDDAIEQGSSLVSNEDSISGMQSKFKVQMPQHRDVKMPMDVKPPLDPQLNLFTFRHMVHQPNRPRQSPSDNSGQKRVLPRTFVCRTCNKAFTRSHHLRRHELIHSGQKPFKCTICGRAFNRSDHLNLHLATHYQSANGPRSYNKDSSKGKRKEGDSGAYHLEGVPGADGVAEKEPLGPAGDGMADGNDPKGEEHPIPILRENSPVAQTESRVIMEEINVDSSTAERANVSTVDVGRAVESSQKFDIISSM